MAGATSSADVPISAECVFVTHFGKFTVEACGGGYGQKAARRRGEEKGPKAARSPVIKTRQELAGNFRS
jgi:hypothetical protein